MVILYLAKNDQHGHEVAWVLNVGDDMDIDFLDGIPLTEIVNAVDRITN